MYGAYHVLKTTQLKNQNTQTDHVFVGHNKVLGTHVHGSPVVKTRNE